MSPRHFCNGVPNCASCSLGSMSNWDTSNYRKQAEECRKRAQEARAAQDREAWLRLANDWSKLANDTPGGSTPAVTGSAAPHGA